MIGPDAHVGPEVLSSRQAFLAGEGRKVTAVNAVLTAEQIVVYDKRFSDGAAASVSPDGANAWMVG